MNMYSRSKKLIIIFLLVLFFSYICSPALTQAQESLSLSITPPLIKNSIEPGQVWKSSIKLVNNNPEELKAYVQIKDFTSGEENGTAVFIDKEDLDDQDYLLSNWIVINEGPYVVPANSSEEIPFIIKVPDNASPGGHYAAILTGTKPPKIETGGSAVKVSAMLATLLLMSVSGETNEAGAIREFSTDKKYYGDSDVKFTVRFENKGNIHLQPQGVIKIYDNFGKEKEKIEINHSTEFGNVLPLSTRKWEFDWQGDDGLLATGRYKAELILTYGEQGKETKQQILYFWIIKYKPLLIILSAIIFIILLLVLFVRRSIKRAIITTQEMVGQPPAPQNNIARNGGQDQAVDLKTFLSKSNNDRARKTGYRNWGFMKKFFVITLLILSIILIGIGVAYYRSSNRAIDKAPDIPMDNKTIKENQKNNDTADSDTSLEPIEKNINELDQAQSTSSEAMSQKETSNSEEKKAGIVVLNGSGQAGAASKIADELETGGYLVIKTGNADSFDFQNTQILFKEEHKKTVENILELFDSEVEPQSVTSQEEDIIIIVGRNN